MSYCAAVILPKYPSVDFNQFLPKSHCQLLSSSYLNDMWRAFLRRAPRPSSSSPPLCTPISNSLKGGFYSRKGCILELRTSLEEDGRLFSRSSVSFIQIERSSVLPDKSPCSGILSVNSFKGFASVAEVVEVLSCTDVDDDIASIEGTQVFLKGVNSVEVAIADNSAGHFREMAQQPKRQQKHKTKMISGLGDGKYAALRRRQYKIETEAWAQAAQEYQELLNDMCEKKLAPNLPYMKSLFLGWFEPFRDQISAEQERCKNSKNRSPLAPYFNQLPSDMMAVITMHKLMSLLMIGTGDACCRVVRASCQIGEAIEQEAKLYRFLQKSKQTDSNKKNQNNNDDPIANENGRLRKKVEDLMKKQKLPQLRRVIEGQENVKPWGQDAQAKVGSRLIELLIDTAYIQPSVDQQIDGPFDIRPAFRHTFKSFTLGGNNSSKRYGVIECDALVRQGLERTAKHMVIPYMPMLIPPVNWTGYEKGGHLFLPSYIMRTHGAKKQRSALKMSPKKQLQPVFEALNTLGEVRWRINKRVLGILDRLWSSGGCLADLVDREDMPLPDKPDTEDLDEIKKWKWKLSEAKKENSERHSLRCDVELKLAVARKMKDEEGFYYPHNLDFRGRAYPMHPHLNHLGSDLCRGILEFAEGRPLGKSGLRWLKIHLANLFGNGIDKKSYEGRIAFTENHLIDIFDSADRPLEGERWWLTAEDPFQCLSACINIAEALRSSSPETTISHLPVHQDGSCNGLQHYAALGRDKLGAAAVNLIAGDKPSDVYSSIAARVLAIMQRDAEIVGAADSNAAYARLLIGHVDRKLVKQTVMTSVYGVTFIGAREQIKKRLKERNVNMDNNELFKASCYAAKITLTALEEMFQAARNIMNWLGDCAKLIALENQTVRWTTPLGLPVVQPYNKLKAHHVRTSLQILTLQRESELVMVKRQRTAFPPNFIHSLDGSHMMMTAVACRNAGLNFAGVHDSYWTHACDVDVMNKILREKFVELYEQPILQTLLENFKASCPRINFPSTPLQSDFDVKEVLDSPYFFN